MLGVLLAGVGAFIDRLQPHDAHQAPRAVTTSMEPVSRKVGCNLATAKDRVFCEHPVELVHQFQRLSIHANGRILE